MVHINTVPKSYFQLTGQLNYISRHDFEVWCVSSPGPELERIGEQEGVNTHSIGISRKISPFQDFASVYKILRFFLRVRPTIVHVHTPKGAFLGMLAAWISRVPIRIYHVHGLRFVTMTGWKRNLLLLVEKCTALLATKVYCVSPSIERLYCRMRFCPKKKISVPVNGSVNGVDATGRFNPDRLKCERTLIRNEHNIPQDAIVIGFVGRIARDKGFIELVQAWCQLRDQIPNLHMMIVGPFEAEDPPPVEVRAELISDPNIHLVGSVDEPEQYYAAMDIYTLPSYREGFGTTSLEASAMGLPVVATRVPGCVDAVVNGVTGTLVTVRNAQSLKDALYKYSTEPIMRFEHGRNGRNRVLLDFKPIDIWHFMLKEYISFVEKIYDR